MTWSAPLYPFIRNRRDLDHWVNKKKLKTFYPPHTSSYMTVESSLLIRSRGDLFWDLLNTHDV